MSAEWVPALVANLFALAVLVILVADFSLKRNRVLMLDQSLFLGMLMLNIVLLVVDSGTWLLNGRTEPEARVLNVLFTTVYYSLTPLMSLLYVCFCDVKLGVPPLRRLRLLFLYAIPVVVNLILSVASVRYALLFSIGPDNVYTRAPLLPLSFVLSYALLPVAFVRVYFTRRRIKDAREQAIFVPNRHGLRSLLIFPLLPLTGGIVLIWFNQVTVVWLTTVIALLVVYINMQNVEISTDALTGLYNRRQADAYLWNLLQDRAKYPSLSLTILDINNFKQINDSCGHLCGDNALRAMAATLNAVCGKDAFFGRYGGDEFVIISRDGSEAQTAEWVGQINLRLAIYVAAHQYNFPLTVSAGVAVWDDRYDSTDQLFAVADQKLYTSKAMLRRRAADAR